MSVELNRTLFTHLVDGMERIAKGKPQDGATSAALRGAWQAMQEGREFVCSKYLTKEEIDFFDRMTQRVIYLFSGSSEDRPEIELAFALRLGVLKTAPSFQPKRKKGHRPLPSSKEQPSSGKFPRKELEPKGRESFWFTKVERVWRAFCSLFEARTSESEWQKIFQGHGDVADFNKN